jgi:hypothetical protein
MTAAGLGLKSPFLEDEGVLMMNPCTHFELLNVRSCPLRSNTVAMTVL